MNTSKTNSIHEIASELCDACQQLLDCPDLNLDELEGFSMAAMLRAEAAILDAAKMGIKPHCAWRESVRIGSADPES